jgi:hypothetical protein
MPKWSKDVIDALVSDLCFGLRRKGGPLLRRASDLEIEVLARAIAERLQLANWEVRRGPPAPHASTPPAYGPIKSD